MFVKTNHVAGQLYVPYTQNIRNLSQSARRLATGEKIPTAADGAGELNLAGKYEQKHRGVSKLVDGMSNSLGYVHSQDESLRDVQDVLQRMSELAASAIDPSKSDADRGALDEEFGALSTELTTIKGRTYNNISLFQDQNLTLRVGINFQTGAAIDQELSKIFLTTVKFTAASIGTAAAAGNALASIVDNMSRLDTFVAKAGQHANEIERVIDFTRTKINEYKLSESNIKDIDLAVETGEFINRQVVLSASQSVLAQSNGIVQSALQFLGG